MQAAILLCLMACAHHAQASSRVVVTFRHPPAWQGTLTQGQIVKQYGRRLVVDLGREAVLESDAEWLGQELQDVEGVELDLMISATQIDYIFSDLLTVDNDTFASPAGGDSLDSAPDSAPFQWNLLDSEPYSIHAESLWPLTNSTPDVVVAILDTGLPDFRPAGMDITLLRHHEPGYDFISDASISMDSDGRDASAYDPGDAGPDCPEASWHGLRVASVLAADHQGSLRGVAQNCTLLPVRVLGMCRAGD